MSIIYYKYQKYQPHLTSSSKYGGNKSHGTLKFWFSGNANMGRHCLLLQFHISFYIRCTMSFKKIEGTSLNKYAQLYRGRYASTKQVGTQNWMHPNRDVQNFSKIKK